MKVKSLSLLALVLIIFIISGCSSKSENSENIKLFSESIDLSNSATIILNKIGDENRQWTAEEYLQVLEHQKDSLSKAVLVDIEKLNKDYKDFGNQYKNNFINGLELMIAGWEERDNDKLMQGQILDDKWENWYTDNINNIKKL
jgi:hypothetical protein